MSIQAMLPSQPNKGIRRDLRGNIINWFDETKGGWIIRNRQVVNEEMYNAEMHKIKDKQDAAKAVTEAKTREDYPENPPGQNDKLEERVEGLEDKLDAILKKLS